MTSASMRAAQPVAPADAARCLTEDEALAFADGRLEPWQLESFHEHLDACEPCQRVLSEAARSMATAPTAPSAGVTSELHWRTTLQRGTLVGQRYTIRRFIDRGGMGEVYEAFDGELQERVALKTVTSTASDNPIAVRRLKAEVQLARRVSHPNVCRIYDFGTHVVAGGGPPISFLTMEFVEGETLGSRIRTRGPFSIQGALDLARQLLLGLSAAHHAGVLHRDFKSENVMLRKGPSGECTPLILDFGLARLFDTENSASSSVLVGTPGFIAPEQVEGHPHTRASDVYAFGVVWYHLLTGQLPLADLTSPPSSRSRGGPRSSFLPPSATQRAVPRELDALVLKCLQRSPSDRFASAADVLAELDRLSLPPHPKAAVRAAASTLGIAVLAGGMTAGLLTLVELRSVPVAPMAPSPPSAPVVVPASDVSMEVRVQELVADAGASAHEESKEPKSRPRPVSPKPTRRKSDDALLDGGWEPPPP